MELKEFTASPEDIRLFLELPSLLYTPDQLMQDRSAEEQLLKGTHFLNHYVSLTKFLITENGRPLARCILTQYPQDTTAYFGFFESVDSPEVFHLLMDAVEAKAAEKGCKSLIGPLDVSIWIRYRFKTNLFDRRPYSGEPWNKAYYPELFKQYGYTVKERYVSNIYGRLKGREYDLPKYRSRYEEFLEKGYTIYSPRPRDWDTSVREVYRMVCRLYSDFECYHAVSEKEFAGYLRAYRYIVDFSLIKLASYQGQTVGFFMGVPNYHNLASGKLGIKALLEVACKRLRAPEYVLLYMGVEPSHRGLGKAMTYSIMKELARKRASSIGALIRDKNPNYNYAQELMGERYHYELLEKRLANPGLSGR